MNNIQAKVAKFLQGELKSDAKATMREETLASKKKAILRTRRNMSIFTFNNTMQKHVIICARCASPH